jgi:predicted dinucleotide-binding enzyme
MKITIIGHGNVGSALAQRWALASHQIIFGARRPGDDKVKALVAQHPAFSATSIEESLQGTDAIVVAIPAHLTADLARQLGDLSGRILIDTTNSVFRKPEPFPNAFDAFQQITRAEVAKCFNSTGAENMRNPLYGDTPADMFAAGSSPRAKETAMQLARDAGFTCYDFGGDDKVPLLEELCRIWIHLAMSGMGRGFALKVLRRN